VRTVVVTGAAGVLGRRVLERLGEQREPQRVIGIDRCVPADASVFGGSAVMWRQLDLALAPPTGTSVGSDPLTELVTGAQALIHLAWTTGDERSRLRPPDDANLAVLRRLLDAADAAPPAALVHLSSATVYGAWPDNPVPLTEDHPMRPNPELAYAVEKAEAERLVQEWAEDHPQVHVAILRPSVVVGGAERPLYRALGGTRMPGSDEAVRPVQFLHVDDLAAAALVACDRGLRGVYNVAPDAGTGEGTARALSGGVARLALPARVARRVAGWAWTVARRGVPPEAAAYNRYPWVVAADRLKAAGWAPRYTSEEALVMADERSHWDDLPPGRRQEFTLLVAIGAGLAAAGGVLGAVLAVRRRQAQR
jgi:nucleoside-diphosphate-sugar epimerase